MIDKQIEAIITEDLKHFFGELLQGVLLYGSRATNEATPDSDYDIGVLLDGTAKPEQVWELAQEIACKLKQDVDLIDLRSSTTVLQKEAIVKGRWLWRKNAFTCELFEAHVISMYQQLQFDRKDILNDIAQRIKLKG